MQRQSAGDKGLKFSVKFHKPITPKIFKNDNKFLLIFYKTFVFTTYIIHVIFFTRC